MKGRVDFSTYNNDWYKSKIGASRLKQLIWFIVNAVFFINPINFSSSLKVFLLKLFGARLGKLVVIKPGVNIKYPWLLSIGDNSWIGEKVWIDNLVEVSIGTNVCLSQGSMLLTGNHNYRRSTFDLITKPIVLEDGAWVGALAVVCPGVICYSHSILAVGSVATHHLQPYGVYQGNPASLVRERVIDVSGTP
jgi:putative colanic acid biosynthesis acetyltransferase WcaF